MERFLTMVPINKIASVVVNQCGCSSHLELNNIIEQRRLIKANAAVWMQESASNKGLKRKNKDFIKQANRDLIDLNKKLKPYDEWHRSNSPKDYEHAFRMTVKRVFGDDIFKQIELQAKASCELI